MFKSITDRLIQEIESFLDTICKATLLFQAGIKDYLKGRMDRLQERSKAVKLIERTADKLRRKITLSLYTKLFIP